MPLVALALDFAEAVELAPPVAVDVALGVAVAVAVAVAPGLLLALPLGELLAELAGDALDDADLADAAGLVPVGDDETVGHGAAGALLWAAEVPP